MGLVYLHDSRVMNHLDNKDNMVRALNDLQIVVVDAADKRCARRKSLQAAVRERPSLGAIAPAKGIGELKYGSSLPASDRSTCSR